MLDTLCFGGSFNPIHHGHLISARAAVEACGFDRVLLIPSGNPPHKPANADLADAFDRLAMTRLALEGHSAFDVSTAELDRAGPSYTINTARRLKILGFSEVHWLIGADMLSQLPTWHESAALIQEVHFHILLRPGHAIDWDVLPPAFQNLRANVMDAPLIDISATDIRNRIRTGKPIDFLTPSAVVRYIQANRLYI